MKTEREPLTQARVKELFDYSEDEPQWTLRHAYDKHCVDKGTRAGKAPLNRYCDICIDGYWHRLHRIVFMWHHGYMPEYVDHKDQDKMNNLIGNLRECTAYQNHANKMLMPTRTSRYAGVHKLPNGQWLMRAMMQGKMERRGPFNTERRAAMAYNRVKFRLFGEFATLNPMDKSMRINGVMVTT